MAEALPAYDGAGSVSLAASALPVSTLAMVVLFGSVAVAHWGLRVLSRGEERAKTGKVVPALSWSSSSVLVLTGELGVMGCIMLYAWLCENYPLFEHAQKEHLPDFFWFICLGLLLVSFGSLEHDPHVNDLVNRDQSEEWKGWMQTVFLLYHYFRAEEVYNSVRVMISCYVWMTGFGNLSFFYIKRDFGFARFAQMMWRLNFTVVLLCMTLNNMYMLYYICPLHTFYFCLVFVTMRVWSEVNHTKWLMRVKMMGVGLVIFAIWEFGPLFDLAFYLLPTQLHPGAAVAAYGVKYEWHFRSGLDHYSTFFGMIFALNFPQAMAWIGKVERLDFVHHALVKSSVGIVLVAASAWWVRDVLPLPKLEFNTMEPYTFFIPLVTYIFLRNMTPWLRQVHLGVLATIGKYTLETYLLQHHVWLTSNAKTVLVLVPGYPKINLALVTGIYFMLAKRIYRATMTTRALLVPDDATDAAASLGWLGLLLAAAALLAWLLQLVQASWPLVLAATATAGVLSLVGLRAKIAAAPRQQVQRSWRAAISLLVVGGAAAVLAVCVLPAVVPVGAPVNAGPLRPSSSKPSTATCLSALGAGHWLDLSKRICGKSGFTGARCEAENWSWDDHRLEKQCGFTELCASKASLLASGRSWAFVGDATTLELFKAVHRVLDPPAGRGARPWAKSYEEAHIVPVKDDDALPPSRVSFTAAATARDLAAAAAGKAAASDLLVLGTWAADAASGVSPASFADSVQSAVRGLPARKCVILTPAAVVDSKLTEQPPGGLSNATAAAYRAALLAKRLPCQFVADLYLVSQDRQLDTDDGVLYGSTTYQVAAQVLLNAVQIAMPNDAKPAPKLGSKPAAAKGSGGGIAQDPLKGLFSLAIAALMLMFMDNYAGLATVALFLIPPFRMRVTWEESVAELHKKIGVPTPGMPAVPVALREYEPVEAGDVSEVEILAGAHRA
jgi:hypothetical protein